MYVGTHTRYKVSMGDIVLEVVTEPAAVRVHHDGDDVQLGFAVDKLWVLPVHSG